MRSFRLLIFFVVSALSLAAAGTPTCTAFVYVNGINTSPLQAAGTVTDSLVPQFRTYLANKGRLETATASISPTSAGSVKYFV